MKEGITRVKVQAEVFLTFDKKFTTEKDLASCILQSEIFFNSTPSKLILSTDEGKVEAYPRFHFGKYETLFKVPLRKEVNNE